MRGLVRELDRDDYTLCLMYMLMGLEMIKPIDLMILDWARISDSTTAIDRYEARLTGGSVTQTP